MIPTFKILVSTENARVSCGGLKKPQRKTSSDKAGRFEDTTTSGGQRSSPESSVIPVELPKPIPGGDFNSPDQVLLSDDFELCEEDCSSSSIDGNGRERLTKKAGVLEMAKRTVESRVDPPKHVSYKSTVRNEDRGGTQKVSSLSPFMKAGSNLKGETPYRFPRVKTSMKILPSKTIPPASKPFVQPPFQPAPSKSTLALTKHVSTVPLFTSGPIKKGKSLEGCDVDEPRSGRLISSSDGKDLTISEFSEMKRLEAYEKNRKVSEEVRRNAHRKLKIQYDKKM